MKPSLTINIPKQFSKFPAGRYRAHGDFSGERFRDEMLAKAFDEAKKVIVELDGAAGYGSSFLEESFGGLIRKYNFTVADLRDRLEIVSSDRSLVGEIWDYIEQEDARNPASNRGA